MVVNVSFGKEKNTSDLKCEKFDVCVKKIKKSINIFTKKNMHMEVV